MPPDPHELQRLEIEKQHYFLPYYLAVVSGHPEGITSVEVKGQVRQRLLDLFDIDISDPQQSGLNRSTEASKADQWANNLISNHVLDQYMLVVRGPQIVLYPGVADNSRQEAPSRAPLTPNQVSQLGDRPPARIQDRSGSTFQRSLQLADHVRSLSDHTCVVSSDACIPFYGRDDQPYVEVHHVVPMAVQSDCAINLDRVLNMVPLCPRCHACLHHGVIEAAQETLNGLLTWFQAFHGQSFSAANSDLPFDLTAGDLLGMY